MVMYNAQNFEFMFSQVRRHLNGLVNAGAKSGRTKQISDEERRAVLYSLCGHTLNLAAFDIVEQSKIMRDSLYITFEISKLVEFFSKHDSKFEKLKPELAPMHSPGFTVLCLTR